MDAYALASTLVLLAFYFIPSMIASNRRHPSRGGIFVVNLFFGWTLIGWVLALAWAASGPGGESLARSSPINVSRSSPPIPDVSMDRWTSPPGKASAAPRRAPLFDCPECGEPVAARAKFCGECGTKLEWD